MRTWTAAGTIVLLAACTPPPEPITSASADHFPLSEQQIRGEAIYESVCWACHGHGGHGDGPAATFEGGTPPPTFHTQDFAGADPRRLARLFEAGLNGDTGGQPHHHGPFVLDLLRPENVTDAMAYVSALAYPPNVPGSALGGSELYDQYCNACHGQEGRGDGPMAFLLDNFEPSDLTADSLVARRAWDTLFERMKQGFGTAHSSRMPPWNQVLTDSQLWDLVAFMGTMQPETLEGDFPTH